MLPGMRKRVSADYDDSYASRKPGANLRDFEPPKDFMRMVALGTNGRYDDPKACLKSVIQVWKNLTAGWQWAKRGKIRAEVVSSTRYVRSSYVYL